MPTQNSLSRNSRAGDRFTARSRSRPQRFMLNTRSKVDERGWTSPDFESYLLVSNCAGSLTLSEKKITCHNSNGLRLSHESEGA